MLRQLIQNHLPFFGLILPLCCYYLDGIDHEKAYTLGFICEGWKE